MSSVNQPASPQFSIPSPGDFSPEAITQWFNNIERELRLDTWTSCERDSVTGYYSEAGLLRAWRRSFFLRHFADSVAVASKHLLEGNPSPVILDLGCGSGSQALLFALQGATVVGVDMDEIALGVFRKRIDLYSNLVGRRLPITLVAGNTFDIDYAAYGPVSGVYSLFAFNMMQPSGKLVDTLLPHLSPGARWAVLDGNQASIWCRLIPSFRRSVWWPREMRAELERRGFSVVSQEGGVALPPLCWALLPSGMARSIDHRLCHNLKYPISCQTLAVRA